MLSNLYIKYVADVVTVSMTMRYTMRIKTVLVVLNSLTLLVLFSGSIFLYSHTYEGELLASAALAKNSTNISNVTNSSGTSNVNSTSPPNNVSTAAGSEHIYRGGAANGPGGE